MQMIIRIPSRIPRKKHLISCKKLLSLAPSNIRLTAPKNAANGHAKNQKTIQRIVIFLFLSSFFVCFARRRLFKLEMSDLQIIFDFLHKRLALFDQFIRFVLD